MPYYINRVASIVFFLIGLYFLWLSYSLSDFSLILQDTDLSKKIFDLFFPLTIFGAVGVFLIYYGWMLYSSYTDTSSKNSKIEPIKHTPPIEDSFKSKANFLLQELNKFDIKLDTSNLSLEEEKERYESFLQELWVDSYAQASHKKETPYPTPYDILFLLSSIDKKTQPYSKDVFTLHWDTEEDIGYYSYYLEQMKKVSKGRFDIEDIKERTVDDNFYKRELAFKYKNRDYKWLFYIEGKSLNYDLICKVGELFKKQNRSGFAIVDGLTVCLEIDRFDEFQNFIKEPLEWIHIDSAPSATSLKFL